MISPADIVIEIDTDSGFCFGVTSAISKAEAELSQPGPLYCLGDIVHNSDEVERLERKGLVTIAHADLDRLHGVKVLLRAHGEPPSTYEAARRNDIELIDATCPVVLQLQKRIKQTYRRDNPPQIVIYGKNGHAEVNGLVGQTDGTAIVVDSIDRLDAIDFSRPISVYSQTTMPLEGYREMCDEIIRRSSRPENVECHDTICRRVANRVAGIRNFAKSHDTVLFVSGKKSSNGRVLFNQCRQANPSTYFISNADEISPEWLSDSKAIGICGATSTPRWLMEEVRTAVASIINGMSRNG